jgi:hypothetical protein
MLEKYWLPEPAYASHEFGEQDEHLPSQSAGQIAKGFDVLDWQKQ